MKLLKYITTRICEESSDLLVYLQLFIPSACVWPVVAKPSFTEVCTLTLTGNLEIKYCICGISKVPRFHIAKSRIAEDASVETNLAATEMILEQTISTLDIFGHSAAHPGNFSPSVREFLKMPAVSGPKICEVSFQPRNRQEPDKAPWKMPQPHLNAARPWWGKRWSTTTSSSLENSLSVQMFRCAMVRLCHKFIELEQIHSNSLYHIISHDITLYPIISHIT